VETDSVVIVKELLRSGAFVALLPREIVEDEVQAAVLTAKPLPEMPQAGLAGVITREGAVLPPALDALVAAVEDERDHRDLPVP
jgi:DNA-binding transcriptional LysR family regulator